MGLGSGIREDPGSGKNPFRTPDPGVKKSPDPGSGTLVTRYVTTSTMYITEKSFERIYNKKKMTLC
jgi:hypothetical protein